jgi:hypothetical protein
VAAEAVSSGSAGIAELTGSRIRKPVGKPAVGNLEIEGLFQKGEILRVQYDAAVPLGGVLGISSRHIQRRTPGG